jgi:broad specificity phosphatase PhoE
VLEQFPDEYRKRKEDKYNYRYPRGESYQDVFLRLEVSQKPPQLSVY